MYQFYLNQYIGKKTKQKQDSIINVAKMMFLKYLDYHSI